MNGLNEKELIVALAHGDEKAFEQVYHLFYHPVLSFARTLVDREEAMDIAAEKFLKLWNHRNNFENLNNIRAFLYISTRNACLDHLRWKKKTSEKYEELASLTQQDDAAFQRFEVESELMRIILQEAEALPGREAEEFTLAFIEGYKNEQIAATLNLSDQVVRNLKSRAVKKIKTALYQKNIHPAIGWLITILVERN